ncbi:hypothetical protein OCU04_012615 [Sclerotinia nivalis]|uniref:Uncharacterized protein n=1 Tax=Sclerotinia nivalis TaxID=352851 RepID=A0A9X0DCJ9_9HELO|nr:hypothetical protein OCU04_012615 [Sclerotinia nivalis]
MTTIERSPSSSPEPQVVTDDDGRVWVAPSTPVSFYPGDKVYLLIPGGPRHGPYKVAQVTSAGRYVLCDNEGQNVRNGDEIPEQDLEAA